MAEMTSTMASAQGLLRFWLDEMGPKGWYSGGEDIDRACRDAAGALWEDAAAGGLGLWLTDPRGALAYVVLTDQMPRNIHRGGALAFATDAQARAAARGAILRGWDLAIEGPARQFFYLPFVHAENPGDQDWAVDLFAARMPQDIDQLLHARAHRQVIARFGRFPGRNAARGLADTPDEADWLAQGGYGAEVRRLRSEVAGA